MDLYITILAGGQGKRMNSPLPKVLHLLHNKPMIVWLLETCLLLKPQKILIVVGAHGSLIRDTIAQYVTADIISHLVIYCTQSSPLGTANAVSATLPYLETIPYFNNLILNGDVPLLKVDTLQLIIQKRASLVVGAIHQPTPKGYGRIIMKDHKFDRIVEEKDATEAERKLDLVNCGIYMVDRSVLLTYLPQITNDNAQKEYYLTDLIKYSPVKDVVILPASKLDEIYNVNTAENLTRAHFLK
jgi:bifunctional N-acetylglucosamine-1-phosphate-uridyltransferase/glucosamine-1-phosphate-acetyltransferase GlmU-like protein